MKRILLISALLCLFVLTAGTASARVILPPGWPFLPPIVTPPVIEVPSAGYYPDTYGYHSYPYGYYGSRGQGHWGHDRRGYYGSRGSGYRGHGGTGYYGSRGPGYRGHGGYRR